MKLGIEYDDASLRRSLGRLGPQYAAAAREGLDRGLGIVVESAREKCPVRSGDLRNSIEKRLDEKGIGGEVAATTDYAAAVEFGSSKIEARPFLTPARDEKLGEVVEEIQKELDRVSERFNRGSV